MIDSTRGRPLHSRLVLTGRNFVLGMNKKMQVPQHFIANHRRSKESPRTLYFAFGVALACAAITGSAKGQSSRSSCEIRSDACEAVLIDAKAEGVAFPHFWEQMFGSGEAILSLRESYRDDLRKTKQATDFKYVRFHNIFGDVVGLYTKDENGKPSYNYTYVDQIYDGLLANGVRPYVELGFMPDRLATKRYAGIYQPNTNDSPPKSYAIWDDMVSSFVRHLVDRYGIDEVAQWYFEIWNEPDYAFPEGVPKQQTYWDLYDNTARSIKTVSTRLRVGGPATASATWVTAFLKHCRESGTPVDFVSTHMYGDESAKDVFGT